MSRTLISVTGETVPIPDPKAVVHLQFRRFAGCPVCNLHLASFIRRHDELVAAGIREVAVFHSPADELREHTGQLPFATIPDPDKALYREFGVESAPRALLDPRVWPVIVRAVTRALIRRDRQPAGRPHGGRTGLPADFLIGTDGRVLAAKHGVHAYDQWSVDEVLGLTANAQRSSGGTGRA